MLRINDLLLGIAVCTAVAGCASRIARPEPPDGAPHAAAPVVAQPGDAEGRDALLLVVAPRSIAAAMEPLVVHKTRTGMPARLVVIESLDPGSGRDDGERVKRAIFEAHESRGTRYVILAGDASLFPVRFRKVRQVPTDAYLDCTYNPTDLYYANLYKAHTVAADAPDPAAISHSGKFDAWDADGDGVFDEQHWADDAVSYNPDRVDGCPDVAVGRLPVHTPEEAKAYVDKVIRYESAGYSSKLEKLALLADAAYPGSTALCDVAAGAAPARRFLVNGRPEDGADPRWPTASFRTIDFEVLCSGWIVYVGHANARSWCIEETGRRYDAARVAWFQGGDPLRGAVFSVGCETGRFMCWAPSEHYVDRKGAAHRFVWHADAANWTDDANGRDLGPRLVVPPPGEYDVPDMRDRTFACSWLTARRGAIAFAGECLVCPNDLGAELVRDVLAQRSSEPQVLGDLWLEGQRRYWLDNRASEGVFRNPRIYLGIMTLFGDPSLRIPGRGGMPDAPASADGLATRTR